VAVIDAFTHFVLEYMEGINKTSHASVKDLVSMVSLLARVTSPRLLDFSLQFDTYDFNKVHSHPGVRSDLFHRPLHETLITDFFGGVAHAEIYPPPPGQKEPSASTILPEPTLTDAKPLSSDTTLLVEESSRSSDWTSWRAWGGVLSLGLLVSWATLN
jgi:phosphatidylinositol glycan class K